MYVISMPPARKVLPGWLSGLVLLLCAVGATAQSYAPARIFELAPPVVDVDSLLFRERAMVRTTLTYPEATVHYTTDGRAPTNESATMPASLRLHENTHLLLRAFHPALRPSETVAVQVWRVASVPDYTQVSYRYTPHENYPGGGPASLIDTQKGTLNFREPVWSGFQGDDLELDIAFAEQTTLSGVRISTLADPAAWIFPPGGLRVLGSLDGERYNELGRQDIDPVASDAIAALLFPAVAFAPTEVRYLRVIVENTGTIPDWHPGKGTAAWLFVDEVLLEVED